jgi:ABC-type polysaccharide/polyol phosphate export permease
MREPFFEILRSRELLTELTLRELRIRYKQTALGALWAVFTPVLMMLLFSTVFARIAKIDTGAVPYAIFVYCGLLPWQFFASSVKNATESLTRNNRLVTKIYLPREVFPLSNVFSSLVDFCVASLVLVGLMAWYRFAPPVGGLIWLPAILCVQLAFTIGLSLLLSMSNLFFRDVKYVLEVGLLVWMFATSVVYPINPEQIGGWGWLLLLNPMTPIVDAYRQALLYGHAPSPVGFTYAATIAAAAFVYGLKWFHEAEYLFAERV